jgi:sec-independent protein translocase protein TatB
MFDLFSWSHILILLTVALVVVGPKDLPRLMNMAGKWVGKARNMANEFKKSFDEMARQSELDELRAEIEKLKADDPIADATKDLNHEIQRTLNPIDTGNPVDTGEQGASDAGVAPPPRSGEYQVSESAAPPVAITEPAEHEPATKPEAATP